ncbi:PLP-dependent aminotransferase family protein [Pseudonocardia sp. CA-107938]|uniref:MocR-like pyridoxine biosynthesis transcription factor PdxR n=1 Tax=Pseudonocardia sp. CA-107938 TaxID=3240021 RepID=UPI003D8F15FB
MSLSGRTDLTGQVYRQIRAAVLDGRLRDGDPLPSVRRLASTLGISRTTVGTAYERLASEGHVRTRGGAGTYVEVPHEVAARSAAGCSPLRARPVWDLVAEPPVLAVLDVPYDFRLGMVDVTEFPFAAWRSLVAQQLRPGPMGNGGHIDPAGLPELRAALARHVGVSRSVRAAPEDVVVTNGSQQAMDLLARLLVEPGAVVAVESPGYRISRQAFIAAGADLVAVPVDGEGLVVDALPDAAVAVVVTPSHQFPMGPVMSRRRRAALLAWARRTGAAVIEDDYDSEFRYGGRPLEPLHALDQDGHVIYVGSLSKVLLPTLRLGFAVLPPSLVPAMRRAKHVTDWHTEVPLQAAAAQFLQDGRFARHVRRMRTIYARRHHAVRAAVAEHLAGHVAAVPSHAGLHIATVFHRPRDPDAVAAAALEHGIALHPLPAVVGNGPGMLLGYGATALDRIEPGLRLLAQVLDTLPAP